MFPNTHPFIIESLSDLSTTAAARAFYSLDSIFILLRSVQLLFFIHSKHFNFESQKWWAKRYY